VTGSAKRVGRELLPPFAECGAGVVVHDDTSPSTADGRPSSTAEPIGAPHAAIDTPSPV